MNKRTKIICTIGPASSSQETLTKLIKSGMNVARLNFSHGDHPDHARLIKNIKQVSKKLDQPIAILQDLQGPKIRTGVLPAEGVKIKEGQKIILTTKKNFLPNQIPVTYNKLHQDIKAGERLLFDDGLMDAVVLKVRGMDIVCRVITGGTLLSHKGINLPDTDIGIKSITKKDEEDLEFGVIQNVDWIALSFVRTVNDVRHLKKLINKFQKKHNIKNNAPIKIIAKIEKAEAVKNIDDILTEVDGLMVARGDLGIEIPAENVPLVQKSLINKARANAKSVVVATQMLDSMIRNPRPTRAEVSDVANAVIDHTDAVMLSGETATGKYPVSAVQIMTKIIKKQKLLNMMMLMLLI